MATVTVRNIPHALYERLKRAAASLMRGGGDEVPSGEVLRLPAESGCTAYDCEFVALGGDPRPFGDSGPAAPRRLPRGGCFTRGVLPMIGRLLNGPGCAQPGDSAVEA